MTAFASLQLSYEQYMEQFRITAWKDGCIYRTETLGTGWFPSAQIAANQPAVSGIIYAAASDEFAQTHSTIRRSKP